MQKENDSPQPLSTFGVEISQQKKKLMAESKRIRKSMNQNKSLIEAARLKKKAQQDDQEIMKQVELIKSKSLHRGPSKSNHNVVSGSGRPN